MEGNSRLIRHVGHERTKSSAMVALKFVRVGATIRGPMFALPITVTSKTPSSRPGCVRLGGTDSAGTEHDRILTPNDAGSIEIEHDPEDIVNQELADLIRRDIMPAGLTVMRTDILKVTLSYECEARIQTNGGVYYCSGGKYKGAKLCKNLREAMVQALQDFEKTTGMRVNPDEYKKDAWDFWQFEDADKTLRYVRILHGRQDA